VTLAPTRFRMSTATMLANLSSLQYTFTSSITALRERMPFTHLPQLVVRDAVAVGRLHSRNEC